MNIRYSQPTYEENQREREEREKSMLPPKQNKASKKSSLVSRFVTKTVGKKKKLTTFEPGNLYRVKADIPVYLFRGDTIVNNSVTPEQYNMVVGWTSSRPGVPPLQPKVTIPGEEVVMCLAVESFPDRRRTRDSHQQEEQEVSENSVITLIDYSINKSGILLAKDNRHLQQQHQLEQQELEEENLVYEVMLLWRERRHIVVCMGMSSLKLVKSLFFTDLEI